MATTDCTGYDTIDTANGGDTYIRASKVTASATFSCTGLKAQMTDSSGTGNLILSIYSDNAGNPNTLLGNTGSLPNVTGMAIYDLITPVTVTSGTSYWIAYMSNYEFTLRGEGGAAADALKYNTPVTFPATPNPFPTPSNSTTGLQFCITDAGSASPGGTRYPPPPIVLGGL